MVYFREMHLPCQSPWRASEVWLRAASGSQHRENPDWDLQVSVKEGILPILSLAQTIEFLSWFGLKCRGMSFAVG
jgi:hypothetical protein